MSRSLWRAIEDSSGSTHTQAFGVCAAVESVCLTYFQDRVPPDPQLEASVKAEVAALESRKPLGYVRMVGSINMMTQTRALDVLLALVKDGCVCADEVDAWKKLRNACAHGNLLKEERAQEAFDRIDAVTTLLHKLLMAHIGYRGKYKNFGRRGWPVEQWDYNTPGRTSPPEAKVQIDSP